MGKDSERERIAKVISDSIKADEVEESLAKEGFTITHESNESKNKKKAFL